MRALRALVVIAGVGASSFAAGNWYARRGAGRPAEASGREILYYLDPMHPAYRSDSPGTAPDCGMSLQPVYGDEAGHESGRRDDPGLPSGTLTIAAERQQLMGVRLANVERGVGTRTIRTVGRVFPDEGRVYRVSVGVEGWISRVVGGSTGSLVRRGQLLASFASRDILSPQQAYVYALDSLDRVKAKPPGEQQLALVESQLTQALQTVEAVGMSAAQVSELARSRTPAPELQVISPVTGIVLARDVDVGQRYEKHAGLFRIAALDRVWVVADVEPRDIPFLHTGTTAQVALPEQAPLLARVSDVPPRFDPGSRAYKVRLEVENRQARLRPDMLLDVDIELALPEGVVVVPDAVVDSGRRKVVFVDRGGGRLEPRSVRTGWRTSDRVEIVEGLSPGESVVVSGQFLLDSESGLRAALASWQAEQVVDPSCGMWIEPGRAAATRLYRGKQYYFCSPSCLRRFEADPEAASARQAWGSTEARASPGLPR
jgi:Cu(I)/Ag(I) efflux system membrane fusion protein